MGWTPAPLCTPLHPATPFRWPSSVPPAWPGPPHPHPRRHHPVSTPALAAQTSSLVTDYHVNTLH